VIQVPALQSEEALVLRILEETHVLVHPGYFFDFDREGTIVISLLTEPGTFAEGLRRVTMSAERS